LGVVFCSVNLLILPIFGIFFLPILQHNFFWVWGEQEKKNLDHMHRNFWCVGKFTRVCGKEEGNLFCSNELGHQKGGNSKT
jgi:hypothetical protein